MVAYNYGDIISTTYQGKVVNDFYPRIFVLHPSWKHPQRDKRPYMHGLNLNYLDGDEISYLKGVLNPEFAKEVSKTDMMLRQKFNSMMSISQTLKVNSPYDFYNRFIKSFISQHDSYRRYLPEKLFNVRVITKANIFAGKEPTTGPWARYTSQV